MLQRFSFALVALLPLQAFASDDFVISREPTQNVIGGEAPPVADTQSYGGNRPSDTPDIGGAQASAQPARHEHPQPELPAGWTAPQDVQINSGAYNAGNFGLGNGSNNAAMSQIQQLLQNAQGTSGGVAGNAGLNVTNVLRGATSPAGNLAVTAPGAALSGSGYTRAGMPAMTNNIMTPLALAAAMGEGSDGEGPSSPQDRAMMAAYFKQLLQYIQSQPATNFGNGSYGNYGGGYNAPALSVGTGTSHQLIRNTTTGGTGSATPVQPLAFR